MNTVAATGHRPTKIGGYKIPNPTYDWIWQQTEKALLELEPGICISGMALGYDQLFAEVCIKLGIPFIAAVPFLGQELIWPQESKDKYTKLLEAAQHIEVVSPGGYASWKMQTRNQWMVDRCNVLLACWNGSLGGTANAVNYAIKVGKKIVQINPQDALNIALK